jgi:uncharacterized protein (TIGR03083 family)
VNRNSYIEQLGSDAQRIARAIEAGPLDAPVPSCPGWDLRQLVAHTGKVHRFAAIGILHGRPPERGEVADPPSETADLAEWLRSGAASLAELIASRDPDAPAWHPFPTAQRVDFWARRQAHETAMHRWDAETAIGLDSTVDAELSSDGLDELFDVLLPLVLARDDVAVPDHSLHLHCTDVDGEWLVWSDDGEYRMVAEHRKGDAALRGAAGDLLLVMAHRRPVSTVDVVGDQAAADAWLALPGL